MYSNHQTKIWKKNVTISKFHQWLKALFLLPGLVGGVIATLLESNLRLSASSRRLFHNLLICDACWGDAFDMMRLMTMLFISLLTLESFVHTTANDPIIDLTCCFTLSSFDSKYNLKTLSTRLFWQQMFTIKTKIFVKFFVFLTTNQLHFHIKLWFTCVVH